MGLIVLSLLCETKREAEGVTASSSGILVVRGTSSERASDNDNAIDYESGRSTRLTSQGEMRWD